MFNLWSVQILGVEAWEDMHSSPTTKKLFDALNTSFTRGGVNIIRYFYPILECIDEYHTWFSLVTAWPLFPIHIPSVHAITQGRGGEGGTVEPKRRLEGQQQFTKLGRKYQHD
jgi:hypothetical protein